MEGLRVVRVPDWIWGNEDGGEGFAGTVVARDAIDANRLERIRSSLNDGDCEHWVAVTWDTGHCGVYRAGHSGAHDLLIVDNAATGVGHDVDCDECGFGKIKGFRWKCMDCDMNVCSSCYYEGEHNTNHTTFERFDSPHDSPLAVDRRPTSVTVDLKGIFPGALVKKRRDCVNNSYDDDAQEMGIGKVLRSHEETPGHVLVEWAKNKVSSLRLSSLRLIKHAKAGRYIPANLPVLKSHRFDANSHALKFAVGDQVRVIANSPAHLERLQAGQSDWPSDVAREIIGKTGTVRRVMERGVVVEFRLFSNSLTATLNPVALKRIGPFSVGQPVKVKNDEKTVDSMTTHLDSSVINKVIGETGRVVRCIDERVIEVRIDGQPIGEGVHQLQADWLEILPVMQHVTSNLANISKIRMIAFADAAVNGQLSAMKQLVTDFGLPADERGPDGATALHFASMFGRLSVVQWLVLCCGADVRLKDAAGRTALHHAAKCGQSLVLEFLIKHIGKSDTNSRLLDKVDATGMAALHLATRTGCKRSVELLASNGCNVNIQNKLGDTALHIAVMAEVKLDTYYNHELLDYLLEKSDVTIANKNQLNPFLLAVSVQNRRVMRQLLHKNRELFARAALPSNGHTALHMCCESGDSEGVELIVQELRKTTLGGGLEMRCNGGLTPLLVAARSGHYGVVEFLVNNNANVKAITKLGESAVHLVAAKLESLDQVPSQRDSPQMFKVYKELCGCSSLAKTYPALAMMCYLVRKGCPWRSPPSRPASKIINGEEFRDILAKYCPSKREESHVTIPYCLLCENTDTSPAIVQACGHECDNICSACVTKIARCPACKSRNGLFADEQQWQESNKTVPFDHEYFKRAPGTSGNCWPAALRADDNDEQQKLYDWNAARRSSLHDTNRQEFAVPFYVWSRIRARADDWMTMATIKTNSMTTMGESIAHCPVSSYSKASELSESDDALETCVNSKDDEDTDGEQEDDKRTQEESANQQRQQTADINPLHVLCDAASASMELTDVNSTSTADDSTRDGSADSLASTQEYGKVCGAKLVEVHALNWKLASYARDGAAIPKEAIQKLKAASKAGKEIIVYNGHRYSLQRCRKDNIRVYQCTNTRPAAGNGAQSKTKCAATISEIVDHITNEVVMYAEGSMPHEHAKLKRRTRNAYIDTIPAKQGKLTV